MQHLCQNHCLVLMDQECTVTFLYLKEGENAFYDANR